ncbi:MAG: cobalt ECF transporter T component CbiQ [Actinobacteria bacterium]|nr:cobalt ECF transporter T component CbiQ [Actinomycetota bacterium]MCG2798644.1 cobalt ECF transporter T component CbiQ [Cellulomonas sp.]
MTATSAALVLPEPAAATATGPHTVPEWLTAPVSDDPTYAPGGRRLRRSFVEQNLDSSARLLRQAMFAEDDAQADGLLQRLDPRAKLIGLLIVLIGLSLVRNPAVLVGAYAGTLALAAASRVQVLPFLRRVWVAVPLFTAVVVAPATLSVVLPGDVVVPLWTWDGTVEGFTSQGLTSAAMLIGRVACSVSAVLLLTLTTPWVRLLAALGGLGVPRMFVMVIAMAYRYVFLLLGTVTDMYTSRRSRTVGTVSHGRAGRALLGASAGALVTKAHHLSDEVHQAMVARGYRGQAHTLHIERLTARDLLAVGAAVAATVALLLADGALGR